jgi:hypothetical protein
MIAQAGEGLPGFSGRDLPLAVGSVTGVRLWHVDMPSAEAVVSGASDRVEGLLTGVFGGVWRRGENEAVCGGGQESPPCDLVPGPECGCGFWAYWALRYAWRCHYYWRGEVVGIIEGYGRTRIGTRGCRCGKARIVGLHVRPAEPDPDGEPPALHRDDLAEILGSYYGVPCYPSLAEMLAAHPLTVDYLPRRQRRLATSATLGPTAPALPTPPSWLRTLRLTGR